MKLVGMADWFRDVGLHVVEEPGWETRGRDWITDDGDPAGMMQHHTACCMPYPVHKLYPTGPNQYRIKCNFSVQPGPDVWTDPARVHVIAAGRANWSSGTGSGKVLQEVRQNIAPIEDARIRRLVDTQTGSRHFINNETAHPGDGSDIPAPMLDAIDLAWYALCKNVPLHPNRLISHAEWTSRKIDPRWRDKYGTTPRSHRIMNAMRARVGAMLGGDPLPPIPPPIEPEDGQVLKRGDDNLAVADIQRGAIVNHGADLGNFTPWGPGYPPGADGDFGDVTETWVRGFQGACGLVATGIVDGLTAALILDTTAHG